MKSKVMLFSEYRIENALFIQKAIYESKVDFINRETFILKFYLGYLHICGVLNDESRKKFEGVFDKKNINKIIDSIVSELIKPDIDFKEYDKTTQDPNPVVESIDFVIKSISNITKIDSDTQQAFIKGLNVIKEAIIKL